GGLYASDLIGFTIRDNCSGTLGEITDINDMTDNVLFIITTPETREILLPVADEFILGIDTTERIVETSYPTEIIELNN
ncbi:MAG: 16S rRNA processing protein RimM, partial [Duncaniella sp.]|nr:16S rRNA processing protein RimM [Duncaniella sp.]